MYRGEDGRTYTINAYCSHSGADLSLGTCSGNQVMCPYHGWKFEGNSRCARQTMKLEAFSTM
ncbi:Rieske 2Fe-2S domain-containing protein [Brevibacillus sp. AY1]|uniref:Rieske 2Fe-2S domain-containing protein n=1 Tax=Brevibacillus sp. AY1 TaxID=2807621 RepID=UPI0024538541|nr:Rieske 2Fe-2S domain-containing protein [Brevibacillus sp. AY1]